LNILSIFRDSLIILRMHKHIAAPTIIVSLTITILSVILIMNPLGEEAGTQLKTIKDLEPIMGRFITIGLLDFFLQIFTQAMVISMVMDVIDKKGCSIKIAFLSAFSRLNALFSSVLFLGTLLFAGMLLLFLPAVIVGYFFMFTIVILMNDRSANAFTAMKLSYLLVRHNLNSAIMFFLSLITLGLIVTLFNIMVSSIPGIGQIIPSITMGIYMAFGGVALLLAYREIVHNVLQNPIK